MKTLDWKSISPLLLGIAGTIIPIVIWRADSESRSLQFNILSQTVLQPTNGTNIPNLKLTLDGAELSSPVLTVVRLSNDGTQPVPAKDFEGPLRLHVDSKAKIVHTSVTELTPPELAPELTNDSNHINISPLLLNPGDSITFSILTSDKPNTFESKARISGIKSVPIEEKSNNQKNPLSIAILFIAANLCIASSGIFIHNLPKKSVLLRPRAAFLVAIICGTSGMLIISTLLEVWGIKSDWILLASAFALLLLTQPISYIMNRAEPKDEKMEGSP